MSSKCAFGKEMPPYMILGACNPHCARRALDAEPQIGAIAGEVRRRLERVVGAL